MTIADRFAPLAFCTLAAGGCLVTFDDYPVGPPDAGTGTGGTSDASSGAAGSAGSASGTGGAGTGGTGTGGTGIGGTGMGGTSAGGTSTGGTSTGGSSGAQGSGGSGGCGSDCCGGLCVNGRCQPNPIYDGSDGPARVIAVNGSHVFFGGDAATGTEAASLRRVPIAGGVSTPIPSWNKKTVDALAADATDVFVAGHDTEVAGSGLVQRIPLSSATPVPIATDENRPTSLVLDADRVYWWSGDDQIKRRLKDASAAIEPVGDPLADLGVSFAVGAGFVFLFTTTSNNIGRMSASGEGALTVIVPGQDGVSAMAANSTYVFWSIATPGAIWRSTHSGGAPNALVTNQVVPFFVAADESHVYWITSAGDLKAARAGGAPGEPAIELATGLASPRAFALDDRCIYVPSAGKILRIAKP